MAEMARHTPASLPMSPVHAELPAIALPKTPMRTLAAFFAALALSTSINKAADPGIPQAGEANGHMLPKQGGGHNGGNGGKVGDK